MCFQVLIPDPLSQEAEQRLKQSGITICRSGWSKKEIIREIKSCRGLVVSRKPPDCIIDQEIMAAAPNLKIIARFGAGMDVIDLEAAHARNILITNTAGANANAVAEMTLYLLLACARNSRSADRRFRNGEFMEIRRTLGTELSGKTLGILGCGRIGQLVAQKAALGFFMRILGFDPQLPKSPLPYLTLVGSLEQLLPECDFITLHLPSTKSTQGLIGAEELQKMKSSAYLINTARGDILQEEPLIEALLKGQIAGVGLDVYSQEPLDRASPLFEMDCVVMTPHLAGFTSEANVASSNDVADSLIAVKEGRIPQKMVSWINSTG